MSKASLVAKHLLSLESRILSVLARCSFGDSRKSCFDNQGTFPNFCSHLLICETQRKGEDERKQTPQCLCCHVFLKVLILRFPVEVFEYIMHLELWAYGLQRTGPIAKKMLELWNGKRSRICTVFGHCGVVFKMNLVLTFGLWSCFESISKHSICLEMPLLFKVSFSFHGVLTNQNQNMEEQRHLLFSGGCCFFGPRIQEEGQPGRLFKRVMYN